MSLKGISSLAELMDTPAEAGAQEIALSLIDPDPNQPRTSFDELRLETLAASVKAQGVIEPLIVSHHPETAGRYMLIAGERRWRAAGKAGLTLVPVVVRDLSNDQRLAVQLVENIDREELSVMEEALAVVRLLDFGRKPKEVADMLGKTAAWVSLRKKIAKHQAILEYFVVQGQTGDAETLAMLVDLEKVDRKAFEDMLQQDQVGRAMVREALDLAKARKEEAENPKKPPTPEVTDPSEPAHGEEEAVAERTSTSARSRSDGEDEVPDPEAPAAGTDEKAPARPKAARTKRKGDSGSEGGSAAYDEIARALQTTLGLPVTIDAPRDGKSGELRIGFANLLELEGLQQNLT